jgi:hypothetical protein
MQENMQGINFGKIRKKKKRKEKTIKKKIKIN